MRRSARRRTQGTSSGSATSLGHEDVIAISSRMQVEQHGQFLEHGMIDGRRVDLEDQLAAPCGPGPSSGPLALRLVLQAVLGRDCDRRRADRPSAGSGPPTTASRSSGKTSRQLEILGNLEQMDEHAGTAEIRHELALGTAGGQRVRHPVEPLHPQPKDRCETGQLVVERKTSVSAVIGVRNRRMALAAGGDEGHGGSIRPADGDIRQDGGERPESDCCRDSAPRRTGAPRADPDNSYWAAIEETLNLKGASS